MEIGRNVWEINETLLPNVSYWKDRPMMGWIGPRGSSPTAEQLRVGAG